MTSTCCYLNDTWLELYQPGEEEEEEEEIEEKDEKGKG